MPINPDRIKADLDGFASFSETPGKGVSRLTFSAAWRAARDYVIERLEQIGCRHRIDALGNLHARPSAIAWEAPAWLSGSHLDTVTNGGNYDGTLGVAVVLEVLRAAREDLKTAVPLELVVWAEGEGARFGQPAVGSRAFAGALPAEGLQGLRDATGQAYIEAGGPHGVDVSALSTARLARASTIGIVEVHLDQGATLWNGECPVGVVTAVAGHRHYACRLTGTAAHAGATMMPDRRDALAGTAEVILALEKLARDLGHRSVITAAQLTCPAGRRDFICGESKCSIDFRSPADDVLVRGDAAIRHLVQHAAQHRGLDVALDVIESQPTIEMNAQIIAKISRVAPKHTGGLPIEAITAGATHDAAALAPYVPTSMLLVASRDGLSHDPDEFARLNDIVMATGILLDAVRDRRLE